MRASVVCERVRAQISLQLDGELSRLERRMLASHLGRCSECGRFAAEVTDFTLKLRDAPLEVPERRVVVLRPRRHAMARLNIAVVAVLAIVALGIGSQLAVSGSSPSLFGSQDSVTRFPTRGQLEQELEIIDLVHSGGPDASPGFAL